MYSQQDLNEAVAAGAISAESADALRAHVAEARQMPVTDEENFRLLNSFNDIFVSIAIVLLLVAMGGIGLAFTPNFDGPPPVAGLLVAGTAWMLAEFFTRRRRMALPSIVLLLAFLGGVMATLVGLLVAAFQDTEAVSAGVASLMFAGSGLLTAGAAYLHWRRFRVPITVAGGASALAVTVIATIVGVFGLAEGGNSAESVLLPMVFVAGTAIFLYAMRWDMSDRDRTTRRSDVAFWLHLLAAPMIAHPVFHWIGVTDGGQIGVAAAIAVFVVYILMGIVALAVDRRALLVSALVYVLVALTWLFDSFGAVELSVALTALVIGSALLTLSAFWTPIRAALVEALPGGLQQRLPAHA